MRAILIGAVESSRIALERIAAADGWDCPLVLTLPLDKSSRHSDFVDLAPTAASAGAEVLRVRNINDAEALQAIANCNADAVFVDWGTPRARGIHRSSPEALAQYEFPAGSMGPKVDAACRFATSTGKTAAIGALADIAAIARGEKGTIIGRQFESLTFHEPLGIPREAAQ